MIAWFSMNTALKSQYVGFPTQVELLISLPTIFFFSPKFKKKKTQELHTHSLSLSLFLPLEVGP